MVFKIANDLVLKFIEIACIFLASSFPSFPKIVRKICIYFLISISKELNSLNWNSVTLPEFST